MWKHEISLENLVNWAKAKSNQIVFHSFIEIQLGKCLASQLFLFDHSFVSCGNDNDDLQCDSCRRQWFAAFDSILCHRIACAMNKRKTMRVRPMGSISTQLTCTHVYTEGNHSGFRNQTILFHHFHSSHGRTQSPAWDAQKESNPHTVSGGRWTKNAIGFFSSFSIELNEFVYVCSINSRWTLNPNWLSKWKQ